MKKSRVVKNWKYATNLEITNTNFIENTSGIKGRSYARQDTTKYFKEAFQEFNLFPNQVEDRLGIMLLKHNQDGCHTQIHKDLAPQGMVHVRCNVMLNKPLKGGDAIIENEILPLEQNDLWLLFPSLENHGSTPIFGGERMIYSFGALIKKDEVERWQNTKGELLS